MKAKGIPMSEPEPTMAQKKKARKKAQKEALRKPKVAGEVDETGFRTWVKQHTVNGD